jgi:hypothetical protein
MRDFINNLGYSAGEAITAKALAYNTKGWSDISGASNSVEAETVPNQITNLQVSLLNETAVTLTWDALSTTRALDNGFAIPDYVVYDDASGGGWRIATTTNSNTATIQNLATGSEYQFKVAARNIHGLGLESQSVTSRIVSIQKY